MVSSAFIVALATFSVIIGNTIGAPKPQLTKLLQYPTEVDNQSEYNETARRIELQQDIADIRRDDPNQSLQTVITYSTDAPPVFHSDSPERYDERTLYQFSPLFKVDSFEFDIIDPNGSLDGKKVRISVPGMDGTYNVKRNY